MTTEAPYWLQLAAAAGDALGGVATAAAVILGLHELRSWREQKRAEVRSGPAAAALVEVRDTCAFVHNWCTFVMMFDADPLPEEAKANARQGARWGRGSVDAYLAGLDKAEAGAFAYLDESEWKVLYDAKMLLNQARAEIDVLLASTETFPIERLHRALNPLVSGAARLREHADKTLRPIARFGPSNERTLWRFGKRR